jgi:hypothetical protein
MGSLRFADLQTRPTEVLDLTSLTLAEIQLLVPPFEAAFRAHMADWRLDEQPRTARRYTTYQNCPLPMPDDRLLYTLVYLKTYTRRRGESGSMDSCAGILRGLSMPLDHRTHAASPKSGELVARQPRTAGRLSHLACLLAAGAQRPCAHSLEKGEGWAIWESAAVKSRHHLRLAFSVV